MEKVLLLNCSPVRTGATNEICMQMKNILEKEMDVHFRCIDDYDVKMCRGCRACHETSVCNIEDDVNQLMDEFSSANRIILVSPSYWADVPGQFKVFIDRCTPWSNTHEPHKSLPSGKKGYAVALRTGPSMKELTKIQETIEHFYGHLQIEPSGALLLPSVEWKEDVRKYQDEIEAFCEKVMK